MLPRILVLGLAVLLLGCAPKQHVHASVFLIGAHCDEKHACHCEVVAVRINAKTGAKEWICRQ